ncbi:hypothetical protein CPB84DRAFT_660981 [Gymnopilus junonius]|uniref:Uncharacterized protein n=1 Tax=Gymnopilus junonius TaxID=109634 RepID=A0A9P5TGB7_GYMJU|nr:hypothetical protein CPB84DRAFT_660981 [Gymnopilus junonius]
MAVEDLLSGFEIQQHRQHFSRDHWRIMLAPHHHNHHLYGCICMGNGTDGLELTKDRLLCSPRDKIFRGSDIRYADIQEDSRCIELLHFLLTETWRSP